MHPTTRFLAYTLLTSPLWLTPTGVTAQAGNLTCASAEMDWYTDVVGETPCVTYWRLRSICNSSYKVPTFRSTTPGDNCDDQVSGCCCNSISWALSMLCMNCQYDTQLGGSGLDAGAGAYEGYLGSCLASAKNQTLPTNIQTAVCNKEVKIADSLYGLFWNTGAWFYVYTKETLETAFSSTNNNTFTHCESTTVNTTTSVSQSATSTQSGTAASSSSTSSPTESGTSIGPIVGGVVGGVIAVIAVGLAAFFYWRRQREHRGPKPLDLSKEYNNSQYADDESMGVVVPFSPATAAPMSRYGDSRYGDEPNSHVADPEAFALIVRSPPGSEIAGSSIITPSKFAGYPGGYNYAASRSEFEFDDGERHEDGGPVPQLQRSNSGRLPPAYQPAWDSSSPMVSQAVTSPMSDFGGESAVGSMSSVSAPAYTGGGNDMASGSGQAGSSHYPRDVKRPLGP